MMARFFQELLPGGLRRGDGRCHCLDIVYIFLKWPGALGISKLILQDGEQKQSRLVVVPLMQKRKWGRFITITSVAVKQPVDGLILSNAVRSAVSGLVKSLANEYGKDNVLVNNVCPGYTQTARLDELAAELAAREGLDPAQIRQRWAALVPLQRLGQPEEFANLVVFLASERASYITGQSILVDGGYAKGTY